MSTRNAPPAGSVVLTCGDAFRSWAEHFPTTTVVPLAGTPSRADVDPLLDDAVRLVVAGTDADLAAVLVRLLRAGRLDLPVAFLPPASSEAATVWGIPTTPRAALDLAASGTASPAPLIRDDRGGVVAGVHRVEAFSGVAYCDEHELVRGDAAGLVVRPDPDHAGRTDVGPGGGGVTATLLGPRRLLGRRRERVVHGRAATVGCRPAAASRDGVADPRPLERRSWYRHTEDWHLVR